MTRKEQTGTRDLTFSGWIRTNLPDSSTGFLVSDLDFILYNKKSRRLMLLEVKTRGAQARPWQIELFNLIDEMMRLSAATVKIEYKGWHIVSVSNLDPSSGTILLDGHEIDEEGLIYFLSMQ